MNTILHNGVYYEKGRIALSTKVQPGYDVFDVAGEVVDTGEPFWIVDSVPDTVPALWEGLGDPDGHGA